MGKLEGDNQGSMFVSGRILFLFFQDFSPSPNAFVGHVMVCVVMGSDPDADKWESSRR